MSKIRLNKAIKEFNISTSRLVEFLASKGFEVESNPNTQLEPEAYAALKAEFAKDGEQRKASHEVVISKVPETKLEIAEEEKPQIIKAKAPEIKNKAKVLGKIDLEPKTKKEEIKETSKEEKKEEVPKPKVEKVKEEKPKEVKPKKETPAPKVEEKVEVVESEPEKIETKYQKLDGPKILKEKVDLSQFETKPKPSEKKKQRKRIQKPTNDAKPTQGGDKKPVKRDDKPHSKGGKKRRKERKSNACGTYR